MTERIIIQLTLIKVLEMAERKVINLLIKELETRSTGKICSKLGLEIVSEITSIEFALKEVFGKSALVKP